MNWPEILPEILLTLVGLGSVGVAIAAIVSSYRKVRKK
jgi:hypothetical protein